MGTAIDKSKPVLVTGATGFVAGWLVKRLLEEGLTVHATVRDPSNKAKLKHLDDIAAQTPGEIRYFAADLLTDGAYAEAMQGCEVVFHTASPFTSDVKDAQKELIEPAQLGTRNVLNQANKTESVKRVVVTSSCAAIYGDNADLQQTPNGMFDESVWNTSSSLEHQAYSYSKTLAEQEAWKIAEAQDRWDLVTVNPSLIMGPSLNETPTSESFSLMKQYGDGTLEAGMPRYGIGVVDVRDVAEAHMRAAFTPEASGRYVTHGHDSDLWEIAQVLRKHYDGDYRLPKRTFPKWLIWLTGPLVNKNLTRKAVSRNAGLPFRADNSKGKRELGMTYRPLETTVTEMFQQLIDKEVISAK